MRGRVAHVGSWSGLVVLTGVLGAPLRVPGAESPIALNYNFNGMASPVETGMPDAPDGFRSISDRALYLDGNPGSFAAPGAPVVGATGLTYSINTTPNTLDIVHLGNRSVGGWPYDTTVDGDNIGIRPNWDTNPDHTTPQATTIIPGIPMHGNTQVGVLYQISNGGGSFQVRLGFSDGSSAVATLAGPDWYALPAVPVPGAGVASQSRLGNTNWPATTTNDTAVVGIVPTNNLSVIEGVISIGKLASDGLGNHAGKTLTSLTFQNAVYTGSNARAYAIIAATARGEASAVPTGVGSVSPNPAAAGQPALLKVAAFRAGGANNAIVGVSVDGASIGLPASIPLNDSGQNGDATAGDGVYSATVTIPAGAPASASLPFHITDAGGRSGDGTLDFNIVIPPSATDFGTIVNGTSTFHGTQDAGVVKWLRLALGTGIDRAAGTYLDIDTEGSTLSGGQFVDDTMIGLYTGRGTLVAFDDDDGSGFLSQLSFGLDAPARPAVGNGVAYNGRDGATLPAGTYYLAYTAYASTFGTANWTVTTTTAHSGTYVINFNTNAGASPRCPADLNHDDSVTIDDLVFMLVAFENGDLSGDLDDDGDPAVGTPDGAVTVEDLVYFLAHFEQGC